MNDRGRMSLKGSIAGASYRVGEIVEVAATSRATLRSVKKDMKGIVPASMIRMVFPKDHLNLMESMKVATTYIGNIQPWSVQPKS